MVFHLSSQEKSEVVANCDHLAGLKFSKSLPCAFTEHGAIKAIVLAIRDLMDSPRGKVRKIGFE